MPTIPISNLIPSLKLPHTQMMPTQSQQEIERSAFDAAFVDFDHIHGDEAPIPSSSRAAVRKRRILTVLFSHDLGSRIGLLEHTINQTQHLCSLVLGIIRLYYAEYHSLVHAELQALHALHLHLEALKSEEISLATEFHIAILEEELLCGFSFFSD
ncbi:hypothetical protein B7494_g4782 [Chlorociboria aeruginascens]|nr:hypothetical protein B7494_g4782 [Chlorociboria aeruginascens]